MQVDLISKEEDNNFPEPSSKINDKRPPSIAIDKTKESYYRWR